jgi:tRNA A37 threonylcarbamoyladenosine dehydratase
MQQYSRLLRILGKINLDKLGASTVMVAGLGAVGGQAFETLARSGIGHFILVDGDEVSQSNINRQILALHSTVGKRKTEVAAARGKDINPNCIFTPIDTYIDKNTMDQIFTIRPDVVIDAIDTMISKTQLISYCVRNQIPVISSMGAARKFNPSRVHLTTLDKTHVCPLAKELKARLRKEQIDLSKISCAFSDEPLAPEQLDDLNEEMRNEKGIHGKSPLGSLPSVTAAFGLVIAQAAVDIIIGRTT